MKKIYVSLFLVLVFVASVYAASHTLTYTAAQDTDVQTRLIPMANRSKCTLYGRPTTCVTADLTGRCVTKTVCQAAGLRNGSAACTRWSTEFADSCVIFAANATGQAAYLKESANNGIVSSYIVAARLGTADFCTNWDLMSGAAQDTTCTTAAPAGLGLAAGCRPCPETP